MNHWDTKGLQRTEHRAWRCVSGYAQKLTLPFSSLLANTQVKVPFCTTMYHC